MKHITTSTGQLVMVDDDDYEYLSKDKWYLSNGYAISANRTKMHRLVIQAKDGEIVDHIDRDKLNNTKENLRIVDFKSNVHNQSKRKNTSNKYKGTNYIKDKNVYQSRRRMNGSDYFLGYYISEIAAAYAYNKKAKELSQYILLNEFDLPIEILEEKLISDLTFIKPAEKQSKEPGVYWHSVKKKWEVSFRVNGKRKYFGSFLYETDAINKAVEYKL